MLAILVTPAFAKSIKKLHAKDTIVVDKAVKTIASDPSIGEKRGLGRNLCVAIERHLTEIEGA